MYIKQIIIQGFKSYKEQTVIEPFSPKTNVIVGRNGSGKSNFFAAIRFVLSDAYTHMGREERQALLHEGHGSAVMSAYVEVIFDNSDNRFHTEKAETILRRTIGLKKDEYSIDRKNATKNDVSNLLESAGFSRSNPYYIVPQGRVTALTNMKDAERLNLLKEVAGTKVYENRRNESEKLLKQTRKNRDTIDESLDSLKVRLADLEAEKEELRGFQDKDRDRRCLEYALHHREQVFLAEQLDEIEQFRADGMEGTDDNREAFNEGEKAIAEVDDEIKQLERQIEMLQLEQRQLKEDQQEASKAQVKIELDVKNLREGLSATEQARIQHGKELKQVKRDIKSKEDELARLLPEYNKRRKAELEVKQNLDIAEATQSRLYNKQGRSSKYKNKAERDNYLRGVIGQLNTAIGQQKANRINAHEEVKAATSQIKELETEIEELREEFDTWGGRRQALFDEVTTAKGALEKLTEERKVLRREDDKLESMIIGARRERDRAETDLSHTMDGATSRGLATIRRLKQEQNITGAYGTLAELMEVSDHYRVAAEQTAGNSLFHYIVDNPDTATKLMNTLQDKRGGRLTFVPLSQIRPKHAKLPNANDAIPLLSKITYDKKYDNAMRQVFGKAIVCPSLAIAAGYARSHGCDAITPEGDTANKKGALTGGFIDARKSRLGAVRTAEKWREEYEALEARSDEIRKEEERKEQLITAAVGDLQKKEQKLHQFDSRFDPLKSQLRFKSSHLEKQREHLENLILGRESVEKLMKEHGDDLTAAEAELESPYKNALSADETRQLENLPATIAEFRKELNELSAQRRESESRKQTIEDDLKENLRLRLDELNTQEIDANVNIGSGTVKESERELKKIHRTVANIKTQLKEGEIKLKEADTKVANLVKIRLQKQADQEELAHAIEKYQKKMEKSVQKKAGLTAMAVECAKNIRDLGVLPDEAFEKYSNTESKQIQSRLKKVNEALKKYKHVNKKAFEQYNKFTAERDGLQKRRKELDESDRSIEALIEHLDQVKDETIERTFKQVSKEFATIFERLVPAGRGRLIIQRRTDQRMAEDGDSDEEPRSSVENYTGVGISVSFNSKHDDQQRIQQLSGGQKSLCALALVFAIQQCDPAPFYLFDEIDANLDAQYRTAVAQMLQEIALQQSTQEGEDGESTGMSGQFICTTFRPEMLLVADKCYGVTFRNKTSGIDVVSQDDALAFVDGEAPK